MLPELIVYFPPNSVLVCKGSHRGARTEQLGILRSEFMYKTSLFTINKRLLGGYSMKAWFSSNRIGSRDLVSAL